MIYSTFCNTHVDHITVSTPFITLPPVHKSISVPAWMEICPGCLSCCFMTHFLLLQHLPIATISVRYPTRYPSVCIPVCCTPEHNHRARMEFWHFQQLSSKRKNLQVNSLLDDLSISNTHCVKHRVFCSGELWHVWGMLLLFYDTSRLETWVLAVSRYTPWQHPDFVL